MHDLSPLSVLTTGGGQNLRTRREVLSVADDFLLRHTEVQFIDYWGSFSQEIEGKYLYLITAKI